tara:strand:+ start:658 stop:903 length:246 start_codon:yes stop_codon:yes gene_type:complete
MASESKHYGDIIIWIEKVIDSCNHPLQEKTARKLVRNFENQLRNYNIDDMLYFEIIHRLENKLNDKMYFRLDKLEQQLKNN